VRFQILLAGFKEGSKMSFKRGQTDGALKKPAPNWSNRVADATDSARSLLSHVEGGFDWASYAESNRAYTSGYVRG